MDGVKLILFSGSHPRHLFIHQALLENFDVCAVVSMQRESLRIEPPTGITSEDRDLFVKHFQDRYDIEQRVFGNETPEESFKSYSVLFRQSDNLNSRETMEFVKKSGADAAFIFGCDIIRNEVAAVLPKDKINMHLGLCPWYRGAATLFWPFYNLEPQFAGTTFHQIVEEADAGAIVHQCVPELRKGDGIHDVGSRAVVKAREDLVRLFQLREAEGRFNETPQKVTGRSYLSSQFHPSHLRVVYNMFQNRVVDEYLQGRLRKTLPKLIKAF